MTKKIPLDSHDSFTSKKGSRLRKTHHANKPSSLFQLVLVKRLLVYHSGLCTRCVCGCSDANICLFPAGAKRASVVWVTAGPTNHLVCMRSSSWRRKSIVLDIILALSQRQFCYYIIVLRCFTLRETPLGNNLSKRVTLQALLSRLLIIWDVFSSR